MPTIHIELTSYVLDEAQKTGRLLFTDHGLFTACDDRAAVEIHLDPDVAIAYGFEEAERVEYKKVPNKSGPNGQ